MENESQRIVAWKRFSKAISASSVYLFVTCIQNKTRVSSKSIFNYSSVDSSIGLSCKGTVRFKRSFDGNLNSFDERDGLGLTYVLLLDNSWLKNLKLSHETRSCLHNRHTAHAHAAYPSVLQNPEGLYLLNTDVGAF